MIHSCVWLFAARQSCARPSPDVVMRWERAAECYNGARGRHSHHSSCWRRSFGIHFHRTRILKKATVLGFYLEHHRTMCIHTFLMLSRNALFVDAMAHHHASMFCVLGSCFVLFLLRAQSKISTMLIDNLTIENDSRRCVHSHARTQRDDSQFVFATFLFIVHCCISVSPSLYCIH